MNDAGFRVLVAEDEDSVRQMVALARASDITVLLIGVRMPPNFGAAYNERFQQVFETVAAEFGVHYLPRFLEGVAASDPDLMQADGIHPTAVAQPILAQKLQPAESFLLVVPQSRCETRGCLRR